MGGTNHPQVFCSYNDRGNQNLIRYCHKHTPSSTNEYKREGTVIILM